MYNKIIEKISNKDLAILGFGLEGISTYKFVRRHLPNKKITIIDKNLLLLEKNLFLKEDEFVDLVLGDNYLNNLDKYELIIKTPGVSLNEIDISNIEYKLTSQMELILEVFSKNVIGITGTKGKSTTSSLIYNVIKKQRDNVYLLGNIGNPVLDLVEEYNDETLLVIEISSHQLEYLKISPHISLITNLYEDHLDHALTLERYHYSKLNIFKNQNSSDYAIYNLDSAYLKRYMEIENYESRKIGVSLKEKTKVYKKDNLVLFDDEFLYDENDSRKLKGNHNLLNIIFVLSVSKILNLDNKLSREVVNDFVGLEYRMQNIGTFNNIEYYVDTLATIPEATIESIEAIGNVDTLIIGGMDRGIDYSNIIEYLNKSNINNIICMPTTGNKIGNLIKNKKVYFLEKMNDVVLKAKEVTKKNGVCLLSPAASSYQYYKSYKDKAQDYINCVKEEIE